MTETPIYDAVTNDLGIDLPLPKRETHQEFLQRHGYEKFLERAERILTDTNMALVRPITAARKRPTRKATAKRPTVKPDETTP